MSPTLKEMEAEHQEITSDYADSTMGKVLNMDCLEHMKQIPDNYYDLCLTDPPYGIKWKPILYSSGEVKGNFENKHDSFNWDNSAPNTDTFEEIKRVSKHQVIWGANYFNCFDGSGGALVWHKNKGAPTLSACEIASISWQKKVDFVFIQALTGFCADEENFHPTQKPLKLIKHCVNMAMDKYRPQTIFDPFGGSGTTAIAAKSLGLDWCICELEEDYCKIAEERLKKVQLNLF